ncbi:hemerythrin domain-containing protein [Brevundimonas sp. M20]|uniref:hemerythrin domain-containing protein n=1 Tax=Brevundimonas sp. M20 TaxID=2591463 RepID=UPI00143D206D|nr:hemerythrin domain-containing protein [Brevundimonas sp. M20]
MPEVSAETLALAARHGLPVEMLYLRDAYPRERWAEPGLDQTAAFWLQMHGSFRGHQGHMDGLVSQWRAGGDIRALHRQLIPALQSFLQHLDGHHRIESGQYFPAMRKIEPKIARGIDLLDRDHGAIHHTLETLFQSGMAFHQAISANAPDAADRAARLGDAIDAGAEPLLRHLEDEEDIVIPLIQLRGFQH